MRSGIAAEFEDVDGVIAAIHALHEHGCDDIDAFTPYPSEEVEAALRLGRSQLNWLVFPIGMGGAIGAFLLESYCNAYSFPINVGGRPPFAWISNIPITFETGVLATAVSAFVALFWVLGLPALTHPLFKIDGFERASLDRCWIAVAETDLYLTAGETGDLLRRHGALRVTPFGTLAEVSP